MTLAITDSDDAHTSFDWEPHDETLRGLIGSGQTYEHVAAHFRETGLNPFASADSVRSRARRIRATPGTLHPQITHVDRSGNERMEAGVKGGERFQKLTLPVRPGDRIMVISDAQIPFHDARSIETVERFMDDFQPNKLIWDGDMWDMYAVSKYDKSPYGRGRDLQRELDIGRKMQERQANRHPTADKVVIMGNHEDRMRRFVWENPGVSSLRSLMPDEMFSCDGAFRVLQYGSHVQINDTRIEHGGPVRSKAGMSARALYEKRGTSVIMGHTHRLSQSSHRNSLGQHTMIENGCLCDLSPEYGEEPDWTQGFSYGYVNNGSVHWYTVPILVDGFRAEGRFYRRDH